MTSPARTRLATFFAHLAARLKEPSTYAGIGIAVVALVMMGPALPQQFAAAMAQHGYARFYALALVILAGVVAICRAEGAPGAAKVAEEMIVVASAIAAQKVPPKAEPGPLAPP